MKKLLPLFALSALIIPSASYFVLSEGKAPPTAAVISANNEIQLAPIEITQISLQRLTETISISGTLEPVNSVTLKSQVSGTIDRLTVKEGDVVSKGEVLIHLNSEEFEYAVAKAAADLEVALVEETQAGQDLDRIKRLREKNIETEANLQKAENDYARSKSTVTSKKSDLINAEQNRNKASITAPIDGAVADIHVEFGETIGQTADLLRIVGADEMEMNAFVSAKDIYKLKVGDVSSISVEGLPGEKFNGHIDRISAAATTESRSVAVFLKVNNPNRQLWGGSFATGSIQYKEKNDIVALSALAVREDHEGFYVVKIVDNKLMRQPITIIDKWHQGSVYEVSSLYPDDVIVSAALSNLTPGTPVKIISE